MKIGKALLGAAAIAAALAPISGQAIAAERAAQPVSGENQIGDGPIGILILFLIAAVAIGVVAGDDDPASP